MPSSSAFAAVRDCGVMAPYTCVKKFAEDLRNGSLEKARVLMDEVRQTAGINCSGNLLKDCALNEIARVEGCEFTVEDSVGFCHHAGGNVLGWENRKNIGRANGTPGETRS